MQFSGRIESRLTVPTGGAAVSATVANGDTAAAVTVPAASYYLTSAGGVSSLLTTFQTQLNNTVQGYPKSAAATAAAVGYGAWSAGWLFNITSGNDTGAFGGVTLTAAGTPLYSIAGPAGGVDLAVGVDANADQFTGGNNFNVTATDDLCIAWVAKFTGHGSTNEVLFVKGNSGATRWTVYRDTSDRLVMEIFSASGSKVVLLDVSSTFGSWHVGMAVIDRGGNAGRVGICALNGSPSVSSTTTLFAETSSNADNFTVLNRNVALPALTTYMAAAYIGVGTGAAANMSTNLSTALTNFKNAINSAWTVSFSTTTGLASIGWTGYATPTWSLAWTSTDLRDVLGFAADISGVTTTQTGTQQVRSLWFPDCPLNLDGDPEQAPKISDLRTTQSPTGVVLGLCGNSFYRHTGLVYTHVPRAQVWDSAATYENAAFEEWFAETQMGLGHTWFTVSSPIQVYAHDGTRLGSAQNVSGWTITGLERIEPRKSIGQWAGLFRIEFPQLVSNG